jgi:hypothetical protein
LILKCSEESDLLALESRAVMMEEISSAGIDLSFEEEAACGAAAAASMFAS